jgi:transposase, IS5 family
MMRIPINLPDIYYGKVYILLIPLYIMDSFTTWMLKGLHSKQEKSRLSQISNMIDWTPFRQILEEMYDNKSEKGGRPNCDAILMFKILILQKWYGLSDLEVERQMADRISFMAFLDFPDPFPDSRTIWLFKQRIAESGKDELIWAELQRQLDAMGLQVKRGTMQDATFIEADPGSSKKPRGDGAKTRRSRDGTWAKKGDEIHFGYKLHPKKPISITA